MYAYVCICTCFLFLYVLTLGKHFQRFIDITSFKLWRHPREVNISLKVRLTCYHTLKPYVE